MKTKLLSLLLLLGLFLSLTACGNQTVPSQPPADDTATYIFTDSVGRQVELPETITRLAPSGPIAEMLLFALAPDRIVGLSNAWSADAKQYIDETYYNLPVLGQLYGSTGELNLESLLLADPQIIIDIGEPKDTIVEDLDALQDKTGIPCIHITATINTMDDAFRTLGELLQLEAEAEILATYCDDAYTTCANLMAQVGEENKVSFLYCLGDTGTNILAKGSYHAEVIDMMTDNVAVVDNPVSKGTGNDSDLEQLYLWNPQYIAFAPESMYPYVAEDPKWQVIDAIQNGNYFEVPYGPHNWLGSPPSVQRLLGMLWLGKQLYPEQATYNLQDRVTEYYDLFYHCTLTTEQYNALTARSLNR